MGSPTPPPGLPLWEAAEKFRAQKDLTIAEFCLSVRLGVHTYNSLRLRQYRPQRRTVSKFAKALGLDEQAALMLAGHATESVEGSKHPPGLPLVFRIEAYCAESGMTQTELAKQLGVGRGSFSRLRSQVRRPFVSTVGKIAAGIGLDLAEAMRLAGFEGSESSAHSAALVPESMNAKTHVQSLRRLAQENGCTVGDLMVRLGCAREDMVLTE